jgi:hypothetical protein
MEDPFPTPNPDGRFLPEVEQVLRKAGWFPGRVVARSQFAKWACIESSTRWRDKYPSKNHTMQARLFPAAWRALREFGGLTINQQKTFYIDPLEAKYFVGSDDWFVAEWCAGGTLYPLGADNDESMFAITGQGQVIDNFDQLVGNTIEEALTNLIMGYRFQGLAFPQEKFLEASFAMWMMDKELG